MTLWDSSVWLSAPDKTRNILPFPHQSPGGPPISCTFLKDRALVQTNAYPLSAFPNTKSDSKSNRLMRNREMFHNEKTSFEQVPFILYSTRQAIFFGWVPGQGKVHPCANVLIIPVLNPRQRTTCAPLCATNFCMNYFFFTMIIQEQNKRWSKTVHYEKFNGWKILGEKTQNGTTNSKNVTSAVTRSIKV